MPRVPTSDNVVPMQQADIPGVTPSPTMFAMAAAAMHQEGRLFDLPKTPTYKVLDGPTE